MAKGASATTLDFTNVQDGQMFNKVHQKEGDYLAKVTKVQDAKSKQSGEKMWLFTISVGRGSYPYYCVLNEKNIWKVRNLFVAAGINVPKKRVNVNPNLVVGKPIGVTLEDEEYEGKMQSVISSTFPTSELDGEGSDDTDDEDETSEPVEAPQGKKKKDKKKAKTVDEVADSELEELEIEDL